MKQGDYFIFLRFFPGSIMILWSFLKYGLVPPEEYPDPERLRRQVKIPDIIRKSLHRPGRVFLKNAVLIVMCDGICDYLVVSFLRFWIESIFRQKITDRSQL